MPDLPVGVRALPVVLSAPETVPLVRRAVRGVRREARRVIPKSKYRQLSVDPSVVYPSLPHPRSPGRTCLPPHGATWRTHTHVCSSRWYFGNGKSESYLNWVPLHPSTRSRRLSFTSHFVNTVQHNFVKIDLRDVVII